MKKLILIIGLIACSISALAQTVTTSTAPAVSYATTQGSPFNLSLTVASGTQPFTYKWTKNGIQYSTASNISFPSAQVSDSGTYVCTVSNSYGATVSNSANIVVVGPIPVPPPPPTGLPPATASAVVGPGSNPPPGAAR